MTSAHSHHRLRKFRFERPQKIAALTLLLLLGQCLWVSARRPVAASLGQIAPCGSEALPLPSMPAGGSAACQNNDDGSLARLAIAVPLALHRAWAGQPETANASDIRRFGAGSRILLACPFILAALALGACLWWVTRRLFGNEGGYISLALYCFMPGVVQLATIPNNNILAAFGLFAAVYTAIGVSHAMLGPRRKWRPRILLLVVILGFTAAAHIAAFEVALLLMAVFMTWVAEDHRAWIPALLLLWIAGAALLLFACCGFSPDAVISIFRSGAGRFGFSAQPARRFFSSPSNAGFSLALAGSLALYAAQRRSRYFGNTSPLLVGGLLMVLAVPRLPAAPWLWALPFLIAFVGGVFADALETRWRRPFLWIAALLILAQAALCLASLPGMIS